MCHQNMGVRANLEKKWASMSRCRLSIVGGWGEQQPRMPPHHFSTPLNFWPLLVQSLCLLSGSCVDAINTWGCLPILGRTGPLSLAADFPVWVGGEGSNLPLHHFSTPLNYWPLPVQSLCLLSGGCASAISTWGCLSSLGRTGPLSLAADFPVWVAVEGINHGRQPSRCPPTHLICWPLHCGMCSVFVVSWL
jgi:hypothetical protein